MNKVFVTAEIGINHNGDVDIAKRLIDEAKRAKCSAVKFQKRTPDICIPKYMRGILRDTPFGIMSYYDYKKKIEFGKVEYDEIDEYCKQKNIDWFASSWDIDSQKFLRQYDLKYNKVASAMITNYELLKEIASEKKKTFISTGYATHEDIDKALTIFNEYKCPFILMHTTGLYPCPDNKLNLKMINKIKATHNIEEIGYSSHSPGILDTTIAVVLGAKYLEVHITLDRAMKGSDHSASLEPAGLQKTIKYANLVSTMLGTDKKRISKREKEKLEQLRYW